MVSLLEVGDDGTKLFGNPVQMTVKLFGGKAVGKRLGFVPVFNLAEGVIDRPESGLRKVLWVFLSCQG